MRSIFVVFTLALVSLVANASTAEEYVITIKDHKFTPVDLVIPADTPVKITVKNDDATPEEFESHELKREKVIAGNSKAIISLPALKPGTYKYFGEFNMDTAQGTITAK